MDVTMNEHELQRWLERHHAELLASHVTAALGRGPALGSQRGATWISFQSKHTLGRVVLSAAGHCELTATNTADGSQLLDANEEFTSSLRLDEAMGVLVGHLT
jgi:hypothetical protein